MIARIAVAIAGIHRKSAAAHLRAAFVVGAVILAASLFGILTRPVGLLAAFWPANAILLGLMVRNPGLATPAGWAGAVAGYLAADLMTGGELVATLWLTAANLAGVVVGVMLFARLGLDDRRLRRPQSVVLLFLICVASASAAALVGTGAVQAIFDRPPLDGFGFWLTTELVNALVVLPVILMSPTGWLRRRAAGLPPVRELASAGLPAATLMAAVAASVALGGPAALVYPTPALLWCALSYRPFTVAVLTLGLAGWQMIAVSAGIYVVPVGGDDLTAMMSIRLGIAMLALAPLVVVITNDARNELMSRLQHEAAHDCLTDALSRGAFLRQANGHVRHPEHDSVAVMMLDIDHFKRINDAYGHSAGDRVLAAFAAAIRELLRRNDLFGRLGGEEFALVLDGSGPAGALAVAERIRHRVETLEVAGETGEPIRATVSIGLVVGGPGADIEALLSDADRALYRAKAEGRNRVVVAEASGGATASEGEADRGAA